MSLGDVDGDTRAVEKEMRLVRDGVGASVHNLRVHRSEATLNEVRRTDSFPKPRPPCPQVQHEPLRPPAHPPRRFLRRHLLLGAAADARALHAPL